MQHSPSSLNNHLACAHLTHLNREVTRGKLTRPVFTDPVKQVLIDRDFAHENAYIDYLATKGHSISAPTEVDDNGREDVSIAKRRTHDAIAAGIEFIVQARLAHDSWHGFVDVLQRVETKSNLGAFYYEPIDETTTPKVAVDQRCDVSDQPFDLFVLQACRLVERQRLPRPVRIVSRTQIAL